MAKNQKPNAPEWLASLQPRTLRLIFTAASLTSESKAARKLGVTQSAVSQAVTKIEETLGVTLFKRNRGLLQLTSEGEEVLRLCGQLLEAQKEFERGIDNLLNRKITFLRVGITEAAAGYSAPDVEEMLLKDLEGLDVRIALIPEILKEFAENRLDIVIAPEIPSENKIISRRLLEEQYLIIFPKKLGVEENNLSMEALLPHLKANRFISYRQNSLDRRKAQSFLRFLGLPSGISCQLENTQAVASAVSRGLGWSILPPMNLWSCREQLDELTVHPIPNVSTAKTLWTACRNPKFEKVVLNIEKVFREKFQEEYFPEITRRNKAFGAFIKI